MKTQVTFGPERYCDTGPNEGMTRINVSGVIYLTSGEYGRYIRNGAKIVIQSADNECKSCGQTLGETDDCSECQEYRNQQGEIEE